MAVAYPTQIGTTVRNISGGSMYFGFLGRHGVRLANNATYIEPGDLSAKLSGNRPKSIAQQKALKAALEAGLLRIERMCPILDTRTGTSVIKAVQVPTTTVPADVTFDPSA